MNYAVSTPAQLRTVLRALRDSRDLSQAQLGALLGVSQRRIAAIEAAPGRAGFDQLSRLVVALGGRLVIDDQAVTTTTATTTTARKPAKTARSEQADW